MGQGNVKKHFNLFAEELILTELSYLLLLRYEHV